MDEFLSRFPFRTDYPLADELYVGIGGPVSRFVEPIQSQSLVELLQGLIERSIPFRVLGGGANVLAADEPADGVVVSTRRCRGVLKLNEEGTRLRLDAGVALPWLVGKCRDDSLGGLEPLVGVPGTVGGAVRMNAGGKHGAIGDLVKRVTLLQPDGSLEEVEVSRDHFSYRDSDFGDGIILEAVLELTPDKRDTIFERMKQILIEKRETQPVHLKSTGCFFKNTKDGAAGAWIDKAGLKGARCGQVSISTLHGNFFINEGGGTGADMIELARHARDVVKEKFGVTLEPEVHLWGLEL